MVVKIKNKRHKKCVIKRKIKFQNFKNCLEATQLENKMNYLEKNKRQNAFNEEIYKIALSSNDDKRM